MIDIVIVINSTQTARAKSRAKANITKHSVTAYGYHEKTKYIVNEGDFGFCDANSRFEIALLIWIRLQVNYKRLTWSILL
jgi:hypothetical protein